MFFGAAPQPNYSRAYVFLARLVIEAVVEVESSDALPAVSGILFGYLQDGIRSKDFPKSRRDALNYDKLLLRQTPL